MRAAGPSALALALFLGLGARPAAAQVPAPRGNQDIGGSVEVAHALLDEARQEAELADWTSAAACLDEALVQDPADSDSLYLRALCAVKMESPLDVAIGDLDAALASARFSYYSSQEAAGLKAELLVRERRWKEALAALGPPKPVASSDAGTDEPSPLLTRAKALAGLGDARGFEAVIEEALRRYPDEPSFPRLFLARAPLVPDSDLMRRLGEIIVSRLPAYARADPELPVLAVPLVQDIGERRNAVLAYRSMGGSSPAASLRALEYGLIDERQAASELLAEGRAVDLRDLVSLLALAGSPAGREAVLDALSAWTGTVRVDADGDGVYEGRFALSKGKATSYDLDSRQAGVYDLHLDFSDGFPASARLLRGKARTEVVFSSYPSVASVSFVEGSGRRGYSFGPGAFYYSPAAMKAFAGSGEATLYVPYPSGAPDPSELACAAAALSVETLAGSSRTLTMLDRGQPISSTRYDGTRIVSITDFEKGRPVRSRIDGDGDGRFETRGSFAADATIQSAPEWLETDLDGDGVYEYREQTVFPFEKDWDFDGDGSIDARQLQLADGSIEEDFSSHLDGRLDETLIVKGSKILSLRRDGAALALVPDSNPSLTWIGSKPFDLGSNLPEGEGIFFAMGKRYRLSRVGPLAFAELVP